MNIDTHRHLGGCIPSTWVWEAIVKHNWPYLGESEADVIAAMTFKEGESYDFHRFLDKFKILDKIQWDEELIDSSIAAICQQLEKEEIDFCWLDFSINKYMESMDWHKKEAIQFIHASFQQHRPNKVGLILSLKYESMQASQKQYAKLIDDPSIVDLLFGLDLVGDEAYFDYQFYRPIFNQWNKANKMTRAHVAESQSSNNGRDAIIHLGVSNIAHGLKMMDHQDLINLAKRIDVTFDLGISSNYLTGVWADKTQHPINKMLNSGLRVTLGTDDPVQCSSTLNGEFQLTKNFGVTDSQRSWMKKVAEQNTKKYVRINKS